MKRHFLLLALSLVISSAAVAQVKVGVKAGVSHNAIYFTNEPFIQEVINKRYGCSGGITSTIPFNEKIFVQPELLVLARGWKAIDVNDKLHKIDLEYVSLPLSVGYKAGSNFSILAGAEINYLIESYYRHGFGIDIQDVNYNRFEMGLNGAIAFQFLKNLTLEARYSRGLTTLVNPSGESDKNWNGDSHYYGGLNRSLQLSLAYLVIAK